MKGLIQRYIGWWSLYNNPITDLFWWIVTPILRKCAYIYYNHYRGRCPEFYEECEVCKQGKVFDKIFDNTIL